MAAHRCTVRQREVGKNKQICRQISNIKEKRNRCVTDRECQEGGNYKERVET